MFNLIQKIILSKPAKMINSFAMARDLKMIVRPNALAIRPFQSSVLLFSSSSSTVPEGVNVRARGYPTYLHKGPSSLVSWTTVLSAWTSFVVISLTTLALAITGAIFFFNTFEKLAKKEDLKAMDLKLERYGREGVATKEDVKGTKEDVKEILKILEKKN